jgi:WD40 repeat protein
VRLWDTETGRQLESFPNRYPFWCVAFSPDGRLLAVGDMNREIRVWDITTGRPRWTLRGHTAYIWALAFSPDGQRLASGSMDPAQGGRGEVKLWDLANGKEALTLPGNGAVAFSPDGLRLAAGAGDAFQSGLKIWDASAADGREVLTLRGYGDWVHAVTFRPAGTDSARPPVIALPRQDGTICLLRAATGEEVAALGGQEQLVGAFAFSPDGRRLARDSASHLRVWDVESGREVWSRALAQDGVSVRCLAWSPDGSLVAATDKDAKVVLCDADTGNPVRQLPIDTGRAVAMAFSSDGTALAVAGANGSVDLWDVQRGRRLLSIAEADPAGAETEGGRGYLGIAFDGATVKSIMPGSPTAKAGNLQPGDRILALTNADKPFVNVPDQPHLPTLLAGPPGSEVRLRILRRGETQPRLVAITRGRWPVEVWDLAFRPDPPDSHRAPSFVTATTSGVLTLRDAATGRALRVFRGHTGPVRQIAFRPDGAYVASCGDDGTVRLWDVSTGAEVLTLDAHVGRVLSVSFDPDGRQLVSSGADGAIRVWDVASLPGSPRQ